MDKKPLICLIIALMLFSFFAGYKIAERDYTKSDEEIITAFEEMIQDEDFPPFPLNKETTIGTVINLYNSYGPVVKGMVTTSIRNFCRA